MTRLVCGVPTRVTSGSPGLTRILEGELDLYGATSDGASLEVEVHGSPPSAHRPGRPNPAAHLEEESAFTASFRGVTVRYELEGSEIRRAQMHLTHNSGPLERGFRRWISIGYTDLEESIGHTFHELVAVPAAMTREPLAPVHAAAFVIDGRVVMLGGTGGVGKTTLVSRACMNFGAQFLADDISIVRSDGQVYPNLSFPKMYGYNAEADPVVWHRMWRGRGALDRVHWRLRRTFGPGGVRRRVGPRELFGSCATEPAALAVYAILVRDPAASEVIVSPLDSAVAARMSLEVIRTEYDAFFRHLSWHAFNRLAVGRQPAIELDGLLDRWQTTLSAALHSARSVVVRLPSPFARSDQESLLRTLTVSP